MQEGWSYFFHTGQPNLSGVPSHVDMGICSELSRHDLSLCTRPLVSSHGSLCPTIFLVLPFFSLAIFFYSPSLFFLTHLQPLETPGFVLGPQYFRNQASNMAKQVLVQTLFPVRRKQSNLSLIYSFFLEFENALCLRSFLTHPLFLSLDQLQIRVSLSGE